MEKAGLNYRHSVLLFLTPEFARDPKPAFWPLPGPATATRIIAARQQEFYRSGLGAGCTGGCRNGIWWQTSAWPLRQAKTEDLILSLAAPMPSTSAWISEPGRRFGGVWEERPAKAR